MKEESLANQIDIKDVVFVPATSKGKRKDRALITYAPSTGTAFFNPKMTALLDMRKWEHVVVGYDKKTGIIVIKVVDVEEYGSVPVTCPKESEYMKNEDRRKHSMLIRINHVLNGNEKRKRLFFAERVGSCILLKEIPAEGK